MKRADVERKEVEILIVGGGIAGISAAYVFMKNHKDFLLVDEYPFIGGQYLRRNPEYQPKDTETRRTGFRLESSLEGGENIWTETPVVGCYKEGEIAVLRKGKPYIIKPHKILIATGAREKFLPFPGWTLPDVMSAGAVQALIKTSGYLPAKDVILAGTGPFLLAVAYEFEKAGGRVKEVAELNPIGKLIGFSSAIFDWEKGTEGIKYIAKLWRKLSYGWRIVEARENGGRIKVTFEKKGKRREEETELLAIGHGFAPNIEFAQLCGCPVAYKHELGGWVVKTDDELKCTDRIYAAGEVTGIGGARKALIEGKLAALTILGVNEKERESLMKTRRKEVKFAEKLNTFFSPSDKLWLSIPDETIICRCEDVKMRDIRKATEEGFVFTGEIKGATRVTMGNCQGRICFPIITEFLRSLRGEPPEAMSIRPPIKPVDLGVFTEFEENQRASKALE